MYFAIVTFGSPSYGRRRSYYKSVSAAFKDAVTLGGGSMTQVRILRCETRKEAVEADISDLYPVVHSW